MGNFVDLSGQRFGMLVARSVEHRTQKSGARILCWRCVCDCGAEAVCDPYKLRNGTTTSCGCKRKETLTSRSTKHGMTGSLEYSSWLHIKARCLNPRSKAYGRYGGAGIGMDGAWAESFDAFLSHIGRAPGKGYSVDRVDNGKGYVPGNVRWATRAEQARNTSANVMVQRGTSEVCLTDAAAMSGLKRETVTSRIRRGWSVEEALSTEAKTEGYKHLSTIRGKLK